MIVTSDEIIRSTTTRDVERFMGKFQREASCWLWLGELSPGGYGRFSVYRDGREWRVRAHRFAFFVATGELPELIRHRCDVSRCVNPEHLIAGTHADNTADMVRRGRHGQAKLSPEDVQRVRVLHAEGISQPAIARRFDVSAQTIHRIVTGRGWRSVGGGATVSGGGAT